MPRLLHKNRVIRLLPLAFLLSAGCGGGNSNNGVAPLDPTIGGTRQFGNLEFNATTTKRSFTSGEIVPITLKIKNTGATLVSGSYSGCNSSDARITYNSLTKWLYSETIVGCGAGILPLSIPPGETIALSVEWDQKAQDGSPVSAGIYSIKTWTNIWMSPVTITGSDPTEAQREANLFAPPIEVTLTR